MPQLLKTLIDVIITDIFIGYGLYTTLYLLISIFKKDIILLNKLDSNANDFVSFSGLICFLLTLVVLLFFTPRDRIATGVVWIQPLIWLFVSLLLYVKAVRKNLLARFTIAIVFILSFERFVIIVTSIHRDYVPNKWFFNSISVWQIAVGLTLKLIIFCILATLFAWTVETFKPRGSR